ncbi:HI1450 family dsDNA-mimic protein [Enterovibrio sp. ZSDZ35]|uniref:HI1450 family dsDNA-mimic protein n=1 Tax=Enterovibrio qingdaonensis TaxID=2899818 RepID=A0ABT5QJ23_9GAMM|nr:HI1450 family dsDNA-mimic protein [Enterovibrio sp. ZSDZ35]MDD1780859.1 HI1450 family dsDNA-mimic protein [Enterovibrio sp. ZSDZ35]
METSLLSIDETLETAFDIFYEMAEDNLDYDDLLAYQARFDEEGAGIAVDALDDWDNLVGFDVDRDVFVEVRIGLAANDTLNDVLLRMLISRDPEQKFCHMLWKRAE